MDGDEFRPGAKGELSKMMSFDDGDSHHDAEQAMMMNLGGEVRGMAKLNRAFFTPQETADRLKFLPILKTTLAQVDGTITPDTKAKRKGYDNNKNKRKEDHLYDFGMHFYQELFDRSPEVRDELFSTKPAELLASKLGEILAEVVRMLAIETPTQLSEELTQMALRHIAYGLRNEHVEPFKDALIHSLKHTIKLRGFKWNQRTKRAWSWSLTEITDLLMDGVNTGRPKVQNLQRSWIFLCERLYMEDYDANKPTRSSFVHGASVFQSQFGPAMTSMLGEEHTSKVDEGPKTLKIGTEAVVMPEKKSKKKVNLKKEGKKTHAQKERERLREKAKQREKQNDEEKLKEGGKFSAKLLVAKTVGAVRLAVTSLKPGGAEKAEEDDFRMWSKKDLIANATKEYHRGRLLVGQRFLKLFASRNPWAVTQFDFGLKDDHAEKMGEALELIVNSATKPQVLAHKLYILAIGHVQMGVKASMFPAFEESLFDFLKTTLSEYGEWNKPTEQAWKWMWDIVNKKFTDHIDAAGAQVGVIERSWKYIEDQYDLEDISDIFFKYFFHEAPVLQAYFVKPTKMQRVMFEKALSMIVKSVRDTAVLNIDLKGVAMRHIKYDITAEHLRIFGDVLISVLRDTAGEDHWDEEVDEAWRQVYGHIAQIFNHIISTGKNMVSRALATGNPDELRRALSTAGRKARVLAPLEIETDDSIISPIVWTLQEGQMQMTEELLRDALAIRGDREAYYCGRERLWLKHPWLIRLLVDKAPNLLTTVLDGHLWVSRFMENGHRRVNFYIDELYGNPTHAENRNAYNTTLGVFVSKLPMSELKLFNHPVVIYATDLKWKQFGRTQFLKGQCLNFGVLALGLFYLMEGELYPKLSFSFAILQICLVLMRILSYYKSITAQLRFGNGVTIRLFGKKMFWPYALSDPFLIINLVSSIFSLTMFGYTWRADPFGWKMALMPSRYDDVGHDSHLLEIWADVAAFAVGMLCVQLVESFKLTRTMSAMLFAIIAVISDVVRFMSILLLWTIGFAFIIYWLMVSQSVENGATLDEALHADIGDGHDDPSAIVYFQLLSYIKLTIITAITESNWPVRIMFGLSIWSSVMVLLNLLVSNMVYNYLTLYKSFAELAVRARAELVLRAEEIMTKKQRTDYYERLMLDCKVDFDKGDDGLTGGIQELLPVREMTHPAFAVLDRVERYAGPTAFDAPWEPAEMHSGPTTDSFALTSKARKNSVDEADQQVGGPIDQTLLRQVTQSFTRLNQELYVVKRQLGVGFDNNSQSSGTVASDQSDAMMDIAGLIEMPQSVEVRVKQFSDNLIEKSGIRGAIKTTGSEITAGSAARAARPSTAQKALDVTESVQSEMHALTAQMQAMMAEIQALRAGGAVAPSHANGSTAPLPAAAAGAPPKAASSSADASAPESTTGHEDQGGLNAGPPKAASSTMDQSPENATGEDDQGDLGPPQLMVRSSLKYLVADSPDTMDSLMDQIAPPADAEDGGFSTLLDGFAEAPSRNAAETPQQAVMSAAPPADDPFAALMDEIEGMPTAQLADDNPLSDDILALMDEVDAERESQGMADSDED